jgi:UDP-2,4-diacetamido-2,4,6-trideoxy-beta-L-altropyranose hydrolase
VNFLIRADASSTIGYGHVMRCLALAEPLRQHGEVTFACLKLHGDLREHIRQQGFEVLTLEGEQPGLLAADWLIVDHYGLGPDFELDFRRRGCRVLAIDDFQQRSHQADLILDQNFNPHASELYGQQAGLFGLDYCLLRPDFARLRPTAPPPLTQVSRVLVNFGGSDPSNETGKTLQALADFPQLEVTVVVGSSCFQRAEIEEQARERGYAYFCQTSEMARLLLESQLVMGAAGSTTWERCCLAIPALVWVLADNQKYVAELGEKLGCHLNLGRAEQVTPARIGDALQRLVKRPSQLAEMAAAGWRSVDGGGARRVAEALVSWHGGEGKSSALT